MNDRMSAADYSTTTSRRRHGSKRSAEPNPYRGLECVVCGRLVRSVDPSDLCTTVGPGGETLSVTARHIGCAVPEREPTET